MLKILIPSFSQYQSTKSKATLRLFRLEDDFVQVLVSGSSSSFADVPTEEAPKKMVMMEQ